MMRRSLLASAALLFACAAGVHADPLTLTPAPPPNADGQPLDFVLRLFSDAPPAQPPVATADPISLLPTSAPAAARPARPKTIANVPMPRLRPPNLMREVAARRAALAEAAGRVAAATSPEVDTEITGSIDPATPMADAKAPEPAAAPAAAAPAAEAAPPPAVETASEPQPEVVVAAQSDSLLGDPDSFDLGQSDDMLPNAPSPSGIDVPISGETPADATAKAGAPRTTDEAPFELVRSLQSLQDRMAAGDVSALTDQRALRDEIDRAFAQADPETWKDQRNAEAAVTYVLIGGSPAILKSVIALDPKPAIDQRLVNGVFAYASGDSATAAPLLADIDLAAVPASMAGQVAIAQSALVVQSNPTKAMQLLALARLLAPGTLVEEAAIRRQLFVADQQRDDNAIQSLARQYLDRFRHSVYAGNFRTRFAAALSHMKSIDSEASFSRLDDMLAMVEPDARCELYLTVALASSINKRLTAARLAAERASGLALAGSVQEARARLYHAAALAALPKLVDTAGEDLAGLNRAMLPTADLALLDVVEATVHGVQSATDLSAIKVAVAEPLGAGATPTENPVMKRAEQALADTQTLVAAK